MSDLPRWRWEDRRKGRDYAASIMTAFVDDKRRGGDWALTFRLIEEAAASAPEATIASLMDLAEASLRMVSVLTQVGALIDVSPKKPEELLAELWIEMARRDEERPE